MVLRAFSIVFLFLCLEYSDTKTHLCDSPQYVELGEPGIINCQIEESIIVLSWYNSTDYVNNFPLIFISENVKGGRGLLSDEFDILPTGSLIINKVSLQHEHVFTVSALLETSPAPIINMIQVIVTVQPKMMFPFIHNCGNQSRICFDAGKTSLFICSVSESRPSISLRWAIKTIHRNIEVHYESITTRKDLSFSSTVTTQLEGALKSNFTLLVCEVDSPSRMLISNESLVLVQNKEVNFSNLHKISINIDSQSTLSLNCTEYKSNYIVWRRKLPTEQNFNDLGYTVHAGEEHTEVFHMGYQIMENGTLVIPEVETEHEAFYGCVFGDGFNEGAKLYYVNVYVYAYPVVKGCQYQQKCALEMNFQGILTCTIKRVRPLVSLKWNIVPWNDAAQISFRNTTISSKQNGDTFDVTLSSVYFVEGDSPKELKIECEVPEFKISTVVSLLFKKGPKEEKNMASQFEFLLENLYLIIIPAVGILSASTCIFIALFCRPHRRARQTAWKSNYTEISNTKEAEQNFYLKTETSNIEVGDESDAELQEETSLIQEGVVTLSAQESDPVHTIEIRPTGAFKSKARDSGHTDDPCIMVGIESSNSTQGLRKQFIKEVKTTYRENYNSVKPIPYEEQMICVDRIFVDTGIEFLDPSGVWKRLSSYRDVFSYPYLKSTRRFIEGDPAYGKSLLALQLAYDWCNNCLSSVEIFILLRLRQFEGVKTISEAITRFLLPRDSRLSKEDVANVLLESKSVVLMFDGYDEYPDANRDPNSDVAKIILRQMFQNYEVILTTRSSHLPLKYSPETKRIRLTGFSKESRRNYIQKVIREENTGTTNKIENYLKENPILSNICQTPLFCALFVHIARDISDIRSLNTVTSVFDYAIRCFHSHMKNKMTDENVPMTQATDRTRLYEVAFKSLTKETPKRSWSKKELSNEIGKDVYEEYAKIGIFVEEDVIPTFDGPINLISDYDQRSVKVRFYHKIFCEWYAAHHVTNTNHIATLYDLLEQLDPFDVQYVFRFSCGINTPCAKQIVNYLKQVEGGSTFAILCILEIPDAKEDMKDAIRALCHGGLIIARSDSLLLQQSTLQLLEIATKMKAIVRFVGLYGSFKCVDMSRNVIKLESNLEISNKLPIEDLTISFTNKTPTDKEWGDIFMFCSTCPQLKELWLLDCVPPYTVTLGSCNAPGSLVRNLKVKVKWRRPNEKSDMFLLDLHTGHWKPIDGLSSIREFEHLNLKESTASKIKKKKGIMEDNKRRVENIRETLRTATHIDTSDCRMETIRDEIEKVVVL